jgi:SAM-dependent methyltransferase
MAFGDGIDWNKEARRAAAHDAVGAPAGCQMLDVIREALGQLTHRPRIVDCGCNIGQFYPMFEQAGFYYVGLDQAAEALEIARRRWVGAHFVQTFLWDDWLTTMANAAASGGVPHIEGKGPLDAAREAVRFDVAICNAVLQHNLFAEKERILPRIAQAVRAGGLFAMQESTVLEETRTQLRQDQWIALVERHGFKLLRTWHKNELGVEDSYLFRRA